MMTDHQMASLAQSTSTRIETGSKHIIPVKVSRDFSLLLTKYNEAPLLKNKMKYCMHKDDVVIACGDTLTGNKEIIDNCKVAYPSVITTLSDITDPAKNYIAMLYHHAVDYDTKNFLIDTVKKNVENFITDETKELELDEDKWAKSQIQQMPDFKFMGISLGLAYAHATSGDNVGSSQIGGMITILNGAFPICSGDLVQWYFVFEAPCFLENGHRDDRKKLIERGKITSSKIDKELKEISLDGGYNLEENSLQGRRKRYYDMQQGNFGKESNGKINVAYPKVFFQHEAFPRVFDRQRVFGRAVSNARPFEMVDIMVGRQSM